MWWDPSFFDFENKKLDCNPANKQALYPLNCFFSNLTYGAIYRFDPSMGAIHRN